MSTELTPDEVLAKIVADLEVLAKIVADLPEGAFLTGAVVVLTYMRPGEEDCNERGPFLTWLCDTHAGRWSHLGMLETAAGDFRASLANLAMREDD